MTISLPCPAIFRRGEAFVGKGRVWLKAVDQFVGVDDIVFLARPADEPDWIAERIARRMDLGAHSAA
jgi:hypothetical protein